MPDLTSLTRFRDRGSTERAALDALLDEVLVGTLCSVVDGQPWAVPLLFARDGDRLLVHGSTGAGMLRHLTSGAPAVLSVHSIDAVVVAQTTFDSSANYRSATVRGELHTLPAADRDTALRRLSDRLVPGRTGEVRASSPRELASTSVLALPITDGGWLYKERTGGAGESADPQADVWAGIVPLAVRADEPVPDPWVAAGVPVPPSVTALQRRHSRD